MRIGCPKYAELEKISQKSAGTIRRLINRSFRRLFYGTAFFLWEIICLHKYIKNPPQSEGFENLFHALQRLHTHDTYAEDV